MFQRCMPDIRCLLLMFVLGIISQGRGEWLQAERGYFVVVYRPSHAHLVPHIFDSAEASLKLLQRIFDYRPSEKIIINTYDFSDYGSAGTTTVPQNFIRLQIEPLELGYENIPFNERFQWLISHELVHVVVNDQATSLESLIRTFFSKVPPETEQPLSVFYSLLANRSRYSPRWHQEGIAVFMETWMNGGFGRLLGSFDEMYFRTLVSENQNLPGVRELDAKSSTQSFLMETLFYIYGARFNAWLAQTYGYIKLIEWYGSGNRSFYNSYSKKFEIIFGQSLADSWQDFSRAEVGFQRENIARLAESPFTEARRLPTGPLGWVTSAYVDRPGESVILGYHQADSLTTIARLSLRTGSLERLGTLPSPTILQIASTAYDPLNQLFFYTTNNNKLYRDIYVLSSASAERKRLFKDSRVGQLTVSPGTHELWGVRHNRGAATLVYSAYPYADLLPLVGFEVGDDLQHLAVSPGGDYLAAVLHQSSGRQALIVSGIQRLREGKSFTFTVVSESGSPENPAWSADGTQLFWNAYSNGVGNIYRQDRITGTIEAVTHSLRGIFKPLSLSPDSLFAFEFTSRGFQPILVPNQPAERLPAIEYFGQRVFNANKSIGNWALPPSPRRFTTADSIDSAPYSGRGELHVQSLIPVVTGFQSQVGLGIYSHLSDPLFVHDLVIETAASPWRDGRSDPLFHFRGRYLHRGKYQIGYEHNAPSFYDLINRRKYGFRGDRYSAAYYSYLKYGSPASIKLDIEGSYFTGIDAINDNLISVSSPEFAFGQATIRSTNTRRAIGSVVEEQGSEWAIIGSAFLVGPRDQQLLLGGLQAEAGRFLQWLQPHNILHLKLSGGYHQTKSGEFIGPFYLGGFGNQYLEKMPVRQYRQALRFPGMPIYSLAAGRYVKGMIEHVLPPLRFSNLYLGQHQLAHLDLAWYCQGLWLTLDDESNLFSLSEKTWIDLGAQVNLVFRHWANLESTLSAGIAQAWSAQEGNREWFISLKLLRN